MMFDTRVSIHDYRYLIIDTRSTKHYTHDYRFTTIDTLLSIYTIIDTLLSIHDYRYTIIDAPIWIMLLDCFSFFL